MKNISIFWLLVFVMGLSVGGTAQDQKTANIRGVVKDGTTGETVPLASVLLLQDGVILKGTEADFDGNYLLKDIVHGTYDVEASYVGMQTFREEVEVKEEIVLDLVFPEFIPIPEKHSWGCDHYYIWFKIPPYDRERTEGGQTLGAEDIQRMF